MTAAARKAEIRPKKNRTPNASMLLRGRVCAARFCRLPSARRPSVRIRPPAGRLERRARTAKTNAHGRPVRMHGSAESALPPRLASDDSARLSSASCSRIPGEGIAAKTSRSRGTALAGGGSGNRRANSVGCPSQLFAFGVEPGQAEAHAEAIRDALAESAATKAEVTGLETRMAELKDPAVRHVRHGRVVLRCAQGIRRGRIATAPRPQLFPSFPGPPCCANACSPPTRRLPPCRGEDPLPFAPTGAKHGRPRRRMSRAARNQRNPACASGVADFAKRVRGPKAVSLPGHGSA